ncbi:tRNA-specific adenosine deaminase 1-like, partial [Teleopsis dalmanni]
MSSPYPAGELLAELCLNKFDTLPKTGKPTNKEWTILAGVVQYDENRKESKVVALGAGTKCIGRSKLCSGGLILNDSHAEVLARRALLRYFYAELRKAIENKLSIFQWNAEKLFFTLKRELSFHFISTQTPCGDACIEDESCDEESIETPNKKPKLVCDELVQKDFGKTLLNDSEVVYTGAKLIGEHSDLLQQFVGVVRTKPGRGDRTLSMSCSDKLSRWNVLGVQGALLDTLLDKPIYFETLTFCCSRSNEKSIRRAI